MLFKRLLIGFLVMIMGVFLVRYARNLVQWFGHSATIERYLGAGSGMYLFWRLLGIIALLYGFAYAFGFLN